MAGPRAACGLRRHRLPDAASTAASAAAGQNASTAATAGARTIEHKYGTTTIEGLPERVVSVGFNEQDAILALGVVPVGIRDWYGEQPYAVWPWAQDELGDATPEVLPSNEINCEQIAALQPDLIVGISSGMTEEQYTTLSEIAPTVPQSAEYIDYGVPWQEQQRVIGQALGRGAEAEQLVADVEARFAAVRAEHPQWDGANAVVAVAFNNEYSAFGPQDVRARVLRSLGFQTPASIAELAGDSFFTAISKERLDLLDTDVLVWVVNTDADRAAIEADSLVQQLAATREGRSIFLDQQLSGAASFSSVLSLPYVLDELVPQLEKARGAGTPAQTTAAGAASQAGAAAPVTDVQGKAVAFASPPGRVVAQDYLGELLALGVTPVATMDRFFDESALFSPYLNGVARLGEANTLSVEAVAALKPDLILVNQYLEAAARDQLARIAPTVLINDDDVYTRLTTIAELLGKQQAAQAWVDAYTRQQADVHRQLAPALGEGEKALVVSMWQDVVWIQAGRSVGHTVYTALGFRPTDKIAAWVMNEPPTPISCSTYSRRSCSKYVAVWETNTPNCGQWKHFAF